MLNAFHDDMCNEAIPASHHHRRLPGCARRCASMIFHDLDVQTMDGAVLVSHVCDIRRAMRSNTLLNEGDQRM